jgi:hypothetical protein
VKFVIREYCLALEGVERLRMDDVRQGNIILDVSVVVGAAIKSLDMADVYICRKIEWVMDWIDRLGWI